MKHLLLFALAGSALFAQTSTSSTVLGTVTDPSGAAVTSATVEIKNTLTLRSFKQTTSEAGQYLFPSVEPGRYTVSATATGFRPTLVSNLVVDVTRSYQVNLKLEVGQVAEAVEVTASAAAELQTLDSTVGATIKGEQLLRLPTINRSAMALFTLQPMTLPTRGAGVAPGVHLSGQIGGARSDQATFSLDGADATDLTAGTGQYVGAATDWAGPTPMIPVPAESMEEFRIATTNANATFGRGAGGQANLVTKRGTNDIHGSAYWYLQNDALNANRWDNNRLGLRRPPLRDNRYGGTLGGPIFRNKTFFFMNFEGRRLPQTQQVTRLVPTETFKQGILRFTNNAGAVQSYNVRDFDPRGIGMSPVISRYFALYPTGNDTTLGDGFNTVGFRANVDATLRSDFAVVRLDHNLNDNWRINSTWRYATQQALSTAQVDIGGLSPGCARGSACPGGVTPVEPRFFTASITGTIGPKIYTETTLGYARNYWAYSRILPFGQVQGTQGALAVNDGLQLNQLIDVSAGSARSRQWKDNTYQLRNNTSWVLGRHTVQFGGSLRVIPVFHERNDKVVGSLTSLIFDIDARNGISIPTSARPANLRTADNTIWDNLFASSLGIVNRASALVTRDRDLNLNPFGTTVRAKGRMDAHELYVNEIWRISSNLTLTAGLNWTIQMAPRFEDDKFTFATDASTGKILGAEEILNNRLTAANAGSLYNPTLAFATARSLNRRTPYSTDLNNFAPRIALAYQKGKTVFRGGYGMVYDRTNGATAIFFPPLAVGFSQTVTCVGPRTNGTCATGADPNTAFRIGVDGSTVNLPAAQRLNSPVVLPPGFTEQLSMGIDPDLKLGYAHTYNFTVQRDVGKGFIVEVGYAGRNSRNLIQSVMLNSVPYMMKDSASGQTFAQAFDNIALHLRAGGTAATAPVQPWFENQGRGANYCTPNCSVGLATRQTTAFTQGLLNPLFNVIEGQRGTNPIVNNQLQEHWSRAAIGYANYHAGFLSVNRRFSKGLSLSANYTLSRSWDVHGFNQEAESKMSNALDPSLDYAPSAWDRTHVFNSNAYYELPFKSGNAVLNRAIGGWYLSGIFTAASGMPLSVQQSLGAFGGSGVINSIQAGAIPLNDRGSYDLSVVSNVAGSNGVGINGDPARRGTGLNLFSNPEAAFNSFRPILLSQDGRNGRHTLRGLNRYNTDLSIGKRTRITERISNVFTFDMINAFNRVEFADPSFNPGNNTQLNLQNRANFGVLSTQFGTPRAIQLGLRFEF
jgi:hypothetical protein